MQTEIATITSRLQRTLETNSLALQKAAQPGSETQQKNELPTRSADWRGRFLSLNESHHPKVALLAKAAEGFMHRMLRDLRDRGTWLVVSGQTGCGKTHVARKIARFWDTHKIDAWSCGWLGAISHIPSAELVSWSLAITCDDDEWKDWLHNIRAARVVIIDDVGAESDRFRSGLPTERLLGALNSCERKWVVITTNVPASTWASRFDQRVADRLNSAAHIDMFDVPSYRGRQ